MDINTDCVRMERIKLRMFDKENIWNEEGKLDEGLEKNLRSLSSANIIAHWILLK
jgi:hypothetical protein